MLGVPTLTRRQLLRGVIAIAGTGATVGGYAIAEPWRLSVTRYHVSPKDWPSALRLRCAVIADIHACEPWMGAARIRQIVARTNALKPDVVLLLGDYVAGHGIRRFATGMAPRVWAEALSGLRAPLGVHAVLGNHDWWDDVSVQLRRSGPVPAAVALRAVGIPVYENQAVRLVKDGQPFWLAGLGDQWAFGQQGDIHPPHRISGYEGVNDLPRTLMQVTDQAPVILMAHEPDIFPKVPPRVAVTVCGHTHGGQVTFAGYAPVVPSRYGRRYVYGHVVENGRNLIVSGGLGCSGLPVRFGRPPEIVAIDLGGHANGALV